MKKFLFLVILVSVYQFGYSISDRIKLGITAAPGVAWLKPMGSEIHNGMAGFGMMYGLNVEYYFKDQNYAISTGLFGGVHNAGLRGRDTLTALAGKSIVEKYNTNSIILPVYLKLKTNPVRDRFIFFGELGVQMVFNVSARANYSSPIPPPGNNLSAPEVDVYKENVLQNGNAVQELIPGFRYRVFDFRLSVGGGMEYIINDKTSLIFGIHYNNGFVPVIDDKSVNPKHDGTVARNVLFTIGAMF